MVTVVKPSQTTHQESQANSSFQSISGCCDPAFVKSVFNLNEVFFPFTWRKPVWWLVTSTLLAGVTAIELTTQAFSTAANYNNTVLMAIIYGIDPLIQLISIVSAIYPPALLIKDRNLPSFEENFNHPAKEGSINPDVAIVIPAHLAANKIETTIRSCLALVKPEQIFIVDNGNSSQPLDDTREIIRRISPKINYIWGHIGNKTFAQYIGTLYASRYKYIFTMDDDMRLPPNFSFGVELIKDRVKAICYSIIAVHPIHNRTNLLIEWQSLEYKMADCAKLSQGRFGSVLYPHGAASMWERETFIEVLKEHNAIFFAEDVQLGWILMRKGFQMRMAAGASLATEAPTSMFSTAPNFYQQRVRSWEMGRQVYFFKFLWQFLSVLPPSHSKIDIVVLKIYEAYAVYSNSVDWARFPLFLLLLLNEDYWIRLAIITAASILPLMLWNYIKLPINHRSDLQSSFLQILSFPLFKLIESVMSVAAIIRLICIFGPNYVRKPNVNQMVHSMTDNPELLSAEVSLEQGATIDGTPLITYKKILCDLLFPEVPDPDDLRRSSTSQSESFRSADEAESEEEILEYPNPLCAFKDNHSAEVADGLDVYVNPLYHDEIDASFSSANTSEDSEQSAVDDVPLQNSRGIGFFATTRPNTHNRLADIARDKWLGNPIPMRAMKEAGPFSAADTANHPEDHYDVETNQARRSSYFFNRSINNNPVAKAGLANWLGDSLRSNLYPTSQEA